MKEESKMKRRDSQLRMKFSPRTLVTRNAILTLTLGAAIKTYKKKFFFAMTCSLLMLIAINDIAFAQNFNGKYIIRSTWGCDRGHSWCNYELSWTQKGSKLMASVEPNDRVLWEMIPLKAPAPNAGRPKGTPFSILNYNVMLLSQLSHPHLRPSQRAKMIAAAIKKAGKWDVIVFNEAFDNQARSDLQNGLKSEYPFWTERKKTVESTSKAVGRYLQRALSTIRF